MKNGVCLNLEFSTTLIKNPALPKGCGEEGSFQKPILLGLLHCDFLFCNLLNKTGIRNGRGNLNNADWTLGRQG